MIKLIAQIKSLKRFALLCTAITISAFSAKAAVCELIANGGFEQCTSCPGQSKDINLATPWSQPNTASTDFFHACSPDPNIKP
jgi:hypothetical protein